MRIWIKDRLRELGKKQIGLANALGVEHPRISEMVKGKRGLKSDEVQIFADFLEMPVSEVLVAFSSDTAPPENSGVPLVGKVGAGAEINFINSDTLGMAEAPKDAKPNTVAVEVDGDSMFPAYEHGELLYYSSNLPPQELVNRKCVVQLTNGKIFVKILRPSSETNLWNLESVNPMFPVMTDQAVEWAAKIEWTRSY